MLKFCTLTGVDSHTDMGALCELAAAHPCAEFGFLLSRTRPGTENRYPFLNELHDMIGTLKEQVPGSNAALHICGRAVNEFVLGNHEIRDLARLFDRVQLNFVSSRVPFNIGDLERAILSYGKPVITQYNAANAELSSVIAAPNHHILFDASGGRGLRSEAWPDPLPGKFCGYAGGIGPNTVGDDLQAVTATTAGSDFWIDMENRIRDEEDRFDLALCRQVLETVDARLQHREDLVLG